MGELKRVNGLITNTLGESTWGVEAHTNSILLHFEKAGSGYWNL